MSKSDIDRFDATMAEVKDTKAAGYTLGNKVTTAINDWLQKNPAVNKASLGAQLSLGGIHFRMSDDQKYLRHLKRSVLLCHLTIGGGTRQDISRLKNSINNENKAALRQRLTGMLTPAAGAGAAVNKIITAAGGFGKFELSHGSWQYGNTRQESDAADSFAKAAALTNAATAQGLSLLNSPLQKQRFEAWFGSVTDTVRVQKVKANMRKITQALCNRTVKLYFRGNNSVNGHPTDLPIAEPWSPDGNMRKGDYFGAAWPVAPAAFDQTKSHMLLGEEFFNAMRSGTDSCAGVIVHELSHSEAQTQDHPFPGPAGGTSYGHTKCQWLAANRPDLAVTNADNYEFYCEEFWMGVFSQKPNAAAGKISDSQKRKVARIF